jgi:hypothetical protein
MMVMDLLILILLAIMLQLTPTNALLHNAHQTQSGQLVQSKVQHILKPCLQEQDVHSKLLIIVAIFGKI